MLPGVSQPSASQSASTLQQSSRQDVPPKAVTNEESLQSGARESAKPSVAPDVRVEIRSEAAVASEAQVVSATETGEQARPTENSTQSSSLGSEGLDMPDNAQALTNSTPSSSETGVAVPSEGASASQTSVAVDDEKQDDGATNNDRSQSQGDVPSGEVAKNYASQGQIGGEKGSTLDLVV